MPQMIVKVSRGVGGSEMQDGASGGVEKKSDSVYILRLTGSIDASDMGTVETFEARRG